MIWSRVHRTLLISIQLKFVLVLQGVMGVSVKAFRKKGFGVSQHPFSFLLMLVV